MSKSIYYAPLGINFGVIYIWIHSSKSELYN